MYPLVATNLFRFVMEPNFFLLQNLQTHKMIGIAKLLCDLWLWIWLHVILVLLLFLHVIFFSYEIWHKRLGRLPAFVYKILLTVMIVLFIVTLVIF